MSKVGVTLGYKINAGNYEMLDVNVFVETDTKPGESTPDAIDRVYGLVEKKLLQKVNEAREAFKE